jgi:hypothetical protein
MSITSRVLLASAALIACGPPSAPVVESQQPSASNVVLSPPYVPARPTDFGVLRGDGGTGGGDAGGTGSISNADDVIASLRPRFRDCYQEGLRADPAMEGKVLVSAKVSPAGEVTSADIAFLSGLSNEVAACIVALVKAATFASQNTSSTLQIPVTFVVAKRRTP